MATPWFFEHLGIEATTNSRAIRRAYAIALKKLDQETQAQEFERLRQAYERALAWQEHFTREEDEERHRDEEYSAPSQAQEATSNHAPQPSLTGQAIEVEYSDSGQNEAKPSLNPTPHYAQATPIAVNHSQATARAENATPEQAQSQPQAPSESNALEFSTQSSSSQAAHQTQSEHQVHWDSATGFNLFIALVEASPAKASELLQSKLSDDEALISLEARLQFEYELIAWLQQHCYPQHQLLNAAIQAFRWQEQLPLLTDRNLHIWLQRIVEQWALWQRESPAFKNRVIKGANKSKWLLSPQENHAIALACQRYPLWMAYVLDDDKLQRFAAQTKSAQKLEKAKPTLSIIVVLFIIMIAMTRLVPLLEDKPTKQTAKPKPVATFNMSPELCAIRAKLIGRWGNVYGNYTIYLSFRDEMHKCVKANWWPEQQVTAKEYYRRLDLAHRNKGNSDNASLDGLEFKLRLRDQKPPNDVVMVCNSDGSAAPLVDPIAAGCVSVAITYKFPRIHSSQISQQFCAERSKVKSWYFDSGVEWQNYLVFKQEVLDCLENNWWIGDPSDYLSRLKQAWKAAPKDASASTQVKTIEGSRVIISSGSQLKVGPGGKMTISADGVKVEGNVTFNGQPINNQSISKEDKTKP